MLNSITYQFTTKFSLKKLLDPRVQPGIPQIPTSLRQGNNECILHREHQKRSTKQRMHMPKGHSLKGMLKHRVGQPVAKWWNYQLWQTMEFCNDEETSTMFYMNCVDWSGIYMLPRHNQRIPCEIKFPPILSMSSRRSVNYLTIRQNLNWRKIANSHNPSNMDRRRSITKTSRVKGCHT